MVRRHAEAAGGASLVAACSSFHTSTPLFPVRRLLERITGIDRSTEPRQAVARLWEALDAVGQGDAVAVFAELLCIQAGPSVPPPELDGTRLREVILTTLVAWVRAAAATQPLYLVVDDLQWVDPTTTTAPAG